MRNFKRARPGPNPISTTFAMMSPLALGVGLGSLVVAFVIRSNFYHAIFLTAGIVLTLRQIVTRRIFVKGMPRLKLQGGEVWFIHKDQRVLIEPTSVRALETTDFLYPDPWRPATIGFPGIAISHSGHKKPLELYFAYGEDHKRNLVMRDLEDFAGIKRDGEE